jgi:hypothetical protein
VSHLQLGNPKFGLPDGFFYRSYEPRFAVELRHNEGAMQYGVQHAIEG